MNERKQWKLDYNELSEKIRKQKQLVKETDRAFNKMIIEENIKYFSYSSRMSDALRKLWHELASASWNLYLMKCEAHNKMLELPSIKESAKAAWETKHVQ